VTIKLYSPKPATMEKAKDPYALSSQPWPPPADEPFANSDSGLERIETPRSAARGGFWGGGGGQGTDMKPFPASQVQDTMQMTPEGFESRWSAEQYAPPTPFNIKK
jgi:hypothetical protein